MALLSGTQDSALSWTYTFLFCGGNSGLANTNHFKGRSSFSWIAPWSHIIESQKSSSLPSFCPVLSPSIRAGSVSSSSGIIPFLFLISHLCSWFLLKKVKVKSLSRVRLFATPWTVAYQAPPSMGFSRQEYWSGFLPEHSFSFFAIWIVENFQKFSVLVPFHFFFFLEFIILLSYFTINTSSKENSDRTFNTF